MEITRRFMMFGSAATLVTLSFEIGCGEAEEESPHKTLDKHLEELGGLLLMTFREPGDGQEEIPGRLVVGWKGITTQYTKGKNVDEGENIILVTVNGEGLKTSVDQINMRKVQSFEVSILTYQPRLNPKHRQS